MDMIIVKISHNHIKPADLLYYNTSQCLCKMLFYVFNLSDLEEFQKLATFDYYQNAQIILTLPS